MKSLGTRKLRLSAYDPLPKFTRLAAAKATLKRRLGLFLFLSNPQAPTELQKAEVAFVREGVGPTQCRETRIGTEGEKEASSQRKPNAMPSSKEGITVLGETTSEVIRGKGWRRIGNEAQS